MGKKAKEYLKRILENNNVEIILGPHAYENLSSGRGNSIKKMSYDEVIRKLNNECFSGRIYEKQNGQEVLVLENLMGHFPITNNTAEENAYFTLTYKTELDNVLHNRPSKRVRLKWIYADKYSSQNQ